MLTSKNISELLGKPILLKDGEWVILSARVQRWAGLIATVEKGSEQKKVAVHNAWWDEKEGLYRLEHCAFARTLKVRLEDLSEEYNKALKNSPWRTSVSETLENLTFLFQDTKSLGGYEVVLSKTPITKQGIFIVQLNKMFIEEINMRTETVIQEVPMQHKVNSRKPSKEEVHEILFNAIVSETSLHNILSNLTI